MNIILLIGSPGSGKSTLGAYLAKEHSARCRFFSAGKWIRKNGLLHSKDLRAAAKGQLDAILKDRDDTRLLRLQARRWPRGRRAARACNWGSARSTRRAAPPRRGGCGPKAIGVARMQQGRDRQRPLQGPDRGAAAAPSSLGVESRKIVRATPPVGELALGTRRSCLDN